MIEISRKYQEKVKNSYGEKGLLWLDSIDDVIKKYKYKFGIENIKAFENLTENIVLSGYSNELKQEVIIKLIKEAYNLKKEAKLLQKYSKDFSCECLYYNIEDKVLILERLNPGIPLSKNKNQEERIKQFCRIFEKTTIELEEDKSIYKLYNKRIEDRLEDANNKKEKYKNILDLIPVMYEFYKEIEESESKKYIIHADLSYKNILLSGNTWKVIDPQGSIANRIFGLGKVIKDEILKLNNNNLEEVLNIVSNETGFSKKQILKASLVEMIRATCWKISVNFDRDDILNDIKLEKEILDFLINI